MTDKETELINKYPEAPLIVAMAESAWAGSRKTEKIDFSLSDNLKTKLYELLGKNMEKGKIKARPDWVSNFA
jgi:hypothetical protein